MHKIYQLLLATVLIAMFSIPMVCAEEPRSESNSSLPSHYPTAFQARGIVSHVGTNTLSVDGSRHLLSINATVHGLSPGGHASRLNLRPGVEIGFSFEKNANNTRTITEIWILPTGTIKAS